MVPFLNSVVPKDKILLTTSSQYRNVYF